MSELTLGLDIGVNSIGWSLVDIFENKAIAVGVRVFPEGVDRDQQGGEKSKTQERRTARGTRRQIHRRAHRRRLLRQELTMAGLLPTDPQEYQGLLDLDPYELRCRAINEKLGLHELGRSLQHLNQHRGYLSNRKTDKASDKETQGIMAEMNELAATMQQANCPTLGSYFAGLNQTLDRCNGQTGPHIRRRHTRREMYEVEFERIWNVQQKYYPDLLTDTLKYGNKGKQFFPKKPERLGKRNALAEYGIHGLMFFQRKMYWPKSVVGRCELEPKEKRCPRAARIAQRFRILQEVNNIRLLDRATRIERRLDADERAKVVTLLMESKEVKFDRIRTHLKFPETVRFNFETTRKKLDGHLSDAILSGKKYLGRRWKELPDGVRNHVVDILIEEDQERDVLQKLVDECGLSEEEAKCIAGVNFPEGYAAFSRKAIERLLPHLENGLLLMGNDAADSAIHAAGYLRPDQRAVNQRQFLPASPDVTNPIVRQALVEVRKTVNAVLRELVRRQGHTLAEIHVELAREAKKSFEQRKQMRFDNADRERAREEAADAIEKTYDGKVKPTRAAVNRYLFWQTQDELCPYCGQRISPEQLFGGEADIDHILPRWRSLDDSMGNKVVAHRRCNHEKGDRTPREWLEHSDPQHYEQVLQLVERHLSYGKQQKFTQKDIELKDFVNRQLTDTAYITRCVSQYLQCLGAKVVCTRGDMTADVRYWWGLNSILQTNGSDKKNRDDHRHHAIDALVIALINSKLLFALANDRGENVAPPWPGFRQDAECLVQSINVSHRAQRRLHGALHEETFYGATQKRDSAQMVAQEKRPWAKNWLEDANTYVRRKSIESITKTQDLDKIRDATIREILRTHLRNQGIDPDKAGKLPGDAFKGKNAPHMASGLPIKKIRMLEQSLTFRKVSERRHYQFVKPGNNHHIVYRAVTKKNGQKQWKAEVVTMWDAARRAKAGLPLIDQTDRDGERFILSLSIGEMFEIDNPDGGRSLCVIRKLDQRSKRVNYKLHTDARKAGEIDKDNLVLGVGQMQTQNARKITVNPVGQLRRADAKTMDSA